MYEYNARWPAELKAAEQRRYRAECKVRCLTANLDRVDPAGFDALMLQIELAQEELQSAAADKFQCLGSWLDSENRKEGTE